MNEHSVIDNMLICELNKMNICPTSIELIRHKDGVHIYEITDNERHYILKYFEKKEFRREIKNYKILRDLNVPTINVIGFTETSIVLDDIKYSEFRLCNEEDLNNAEIIKLISKWYKKLHLNGAYCIDKIKLYSELSIFTKENIMFLLVNTNIEQIPILEVIYKNFDNLRKQIDSLEITLTYNDFHCSNIAIAKDLSSVIIFDYNFLGSGCVSSDISNILWQLSDVEMKRIFLEEYGDISKSEKAIIDIVNPIISLFIACHKNKFPSWGTQIIDTLRSDNYIKMLNDFLSNIQ